jgi:ribosomal protein S18 acetylase RimI-like enzyme
VREVRLAALRDTPDWFWATHEEEVVKPESWWRDFVESGAWFLAQNEGVAVGVAAVISSAALEDSTRQLISMWVAPNARRRGIGTRLIDAVITWARAEGIRELQLQVTDRNEIARRFYERFGFKGTGRGEPHPRERWLIEQEMRLRI